MRFAFLVAVVAAVAPGCASDDSDDSADSSDDSDDSDDDDTDAADDTDEDEMSSDDPPGANCGLEASIVLDSGGATVTATGAVTCDGPASIEVETCVQWDTGGGFADISCQTSSQSDVEELVLDHQGSCGITAGRPFRARVNASFDGTDLAEELSSEITCD